MSQLTIIPVTQEHIDRKTVIYTKLPGQKQVSQIYQTGLSLELSQDCCPADQTLVGPTDFALCPGDALAHNAHAFTLIAQPVCREHTKE